MPITFIRTQELPAIREHVAAEAMRQGRVFRREHLPHWGIDPGILRTMVMRRLWLRMRFGVYTDSSVWDSCQGDPEQAHLLDCAAAMAALPLPTFAFAGTAAALHGLPRPNSHLGAIELVRDIGRDLRALHPRAGQSSQRAKVRMKTHSLAHQHLTRLSGIPVVSKELAALSAAANCDLEWAIAILDSASWGLTHVSGEFLKLSEQWPHLKGIGTIRRALPLVRTGSQTPLESLSRIRLLAAGIPEPLLQHPFHDRMGLIGYTDMYWPELMVIGEADGQLKYTSADVHVKEKIREDRLCALGINVVRWTWDEIIRDPASVAERIRRAAQPALRLSA